MRRLRDAKIGPHERQQAKDGEEDIGAETSVLHQRGRDETNDEVVEPVGATADGDTLGTERRGENLGGHGPGNGTPGAAVAQHKDHEEGDAGPALGRVAGPVVGELADENGDDHVGERHDDAADEQELAAAVGVERPQTADATDELDHVQDSRHDELHIVVETHCGEECWRVVDQGIDTDELLEEPGRRRYVSFLVQWSSYGRKW